MNDASLHRKFHITNKKFEELGFYVNGQKTTQFFKKYSAGCYLIGGVPEFQTAAESERIDESLGGNCSTCCVYLFPRFQSAIVGQFEIDNGSVIDSKSAKEDFRLRNGLYGKLTDIRWFNGFPCPIISPYTPTSLVQYDPSTSKRLSSYPLQSDPYEGGSVFVSRSSISPDAGEGLYAKRNVGNGELISFYNGIRLQKRKNGHKQNGFKKWSEFRIALSNSEDLDVPSEYTSVERYRATLGHKACHSFGDKSNSKFENFYHPRFGHIMALVASRDIAAAEEILVNYRYKDVNGAPTWYKNLWHQYKAAVNKT